MTHTHDYDKKIDNLWLVSLQIDTRFHQLNPPGNPLNVVTVNMEIACQSCHLLSEVRCHCHTCESKEPPLLPLPLGWEWRDGRVLCSGCKERRE